MFATLNNREAIPKHFEITATSIRAAAMATKIRKSTNLRRRLFSEALEPRAMMAADVMHNFLFPHDVDDDGSVTPLDALVVINRLNRGADDSSLHERQFHDVDDDSRRTNMGSIVA